MEEWNWHAIIGISIFVGVPFIIGLILGFKVGEIDTVEPLETLNLVELRNELKRREMYDNDDIYLEIERKEEIERQKEIEREMRRAVEEDSNRN